MNEQTILKGETKVTILRTHVAMIEQDTGVVVLDAEEVMRLLLLMKEEGPEIPPLKLNVAPDQN